MKFLQMGCEIVNESMEWGMAFARKILLFSTPCPDIDNDYP